MLNVDVPTLQPGIGVSDLDTAISLAQLAVLHALESFMGAEGILPSGCFVLEHERVIPECHLGEGEAQRLLERVRLGRGHDRLRRRRDRPTRDINTAHTVILGYLVWWKRYGRAHRERRCAIESSFVDRTVIAYLTICVGTAARRASWTREVERRRVATTLTMQENRPESPGAPPQDLWSSILDSVSSTRSIPSKQILLLGEPSSGKTTVTAALLRKNADEHDNKDFAIGYDWADVRDDGDEGVCIENK